MGGTSPRLRADQGEQRGGGEWRSELRIVGVLTTEDLYFSSVSWPRMAHTRWYGCDKGPEGLDVPFSYLVWWRRSKKVESLAGALS